MAERLIDVPIRLIRSRESINRISSYRRRETLIKSGEVLRVSQCEVSVVDEREEVAGEESITIDHTVSAVPVDA